MLWTLKSPMFVILRILRVAAFKGSGGTDSLTSKIWHPCDYEQETVVSVNLFLRLPQQPHDIALSFSRVSDATENKAERDFSNFFLMIWP